MPRALPPRPRLEALKKEAKHLLRLHRDGDGRACAQLRLLRRFADVADQDILAADLALHDTQFALALDYGFASWTALRDHVTGRQGAAATMHVHCGDSSAGTHRRSGMPGQVVVWQDPLLEGPTPADVSDEQWAQIRAAYHVHAGHATQVESNIQWLRQQDDALASFTGYDEVVLWFDACLFDQVILIRHLDWFGRQDLTRTTLSLICCAEFPGRDTFSGLGELRPAELARLRDAGHAVTPEQIDLGTRAWDAYRSPDPTAVEDLLADDTSALPHLGPALTRHLERFPAARNGLSRLQNEALQVLADGPSPFGRLFQQLSAMDHPPFFGDGHVCGVLDDLAAGPDPMLTVAHGGGKLPQRVYTITETGRRALAGQADAVALNGIDRWLGGVHLAAGQPAWRWDEQARRLVAT